MPTVGLANDVEIKFQSAVELVRSLPQKGSFQPSYSDASKVYGYYKQAKLGPCNHSRPAFWDVVNRAKWDAWNVLGNMPKDEAMENYVNEIKKLFERITNMEEFKETQANYSHVIIPFCESTGLEVPAALAEYKKARKKKKEKKKMEDVLKKSNGIANGHATHKESRNIEELEGDNRRKISTNSNRTSANGQLDANGTLAQSTGSIEHRNPSIAKEMSAQAVNGQRNNAPPEAIPAEISSYIDAESSDDDVYCDSINPDEISSATHMATMDDSLLLHNAENGMQNSANNTSMLISDAIEIEEEKGLVLKNSTPIVKMRPAQKEDSPVDSNCSSKNANSDLSALSSLSCELNGHSGVVSKRNKVGSNETGLELELKREFESRAYKHGRRSRDKNRSRDRRQQTDIFGKRELVVGARGNSQTDLAGSGGRDEEGEESGDIELHRGESARPTAEQSSTRLRRARADSSSDSNHSTGSSLVSGETIGEQIVKALGRLERDMRLVLRRLDSIENRITDVNHAVNRRPWWTAYLPSRRYLFLLFWPIFIHFLFAFWRRRRKK